MRCRFRKPQLSSGGGDSWLLTAHLFPKGSSFENMEVYSSEILQSSSRSSLGLSFSGPVLFVLSFDCFEVLVVLLEIRVLLKSDKELSLLGLAVLLTLHGDGLGLDLLELSVLVSIKSVLDRHIK